MRTTNTKTRSGRAARCALALLAAVTLLGLTAAVSPSVAQTVSLVFVPDQGGENDIDSSSLSNQSDLSALGVLGNQYGWKWDEAALSGGNTQDVCVYYSTNGADGLAERAICYQIVSASDGTISSEGVTYWQCPAYQDGAPPGGQ